MAVEHRRPDCPGDALPGREAPGDATEQVALGKGNDVAGDAPRDRADRQMEQRRGDGRVDPLVRPDRRIGIARGVREGGAEIEERLPADEAPARPGPTAQVRRVCLVLGSSPLGSKTIPKNAVPSLSPARFARYEGRTRV